MGLFSGRGYNIDSLAVAEVDKKKNISRITISTSGTPQVLQQIKLQLGKLVPVHKVADFPLNKKTLIERNGFIKGSFFDSLKLEKGKESYVENTNLLFLDQTKRSFVFEDFGFKKGY